MNVIPVIDLKQGVVVRGVGGRRDEYRPIESKLATGATPAAVARGFVDKLGCRCVYVADLDAIGGDDFNWSSYADICTAGLAVWLDAGIGTAARAEQFSAGRESARLVERVIVGLESLENSAALTEIVGIIGAKRCVFSLDLKAGIPITRYARWRDSKDTDSVIDEIIGTVLDAGLERMIVLDLAGVGEDAGVRALSVCRRAISIAETRGVALELVSGGGVRGVDDLYAMSDAGCSAALVASALHDGRIAAEDIAQIRT